jgi:hypothetical protein
MNKRLRRWLIGSVLVITCLAVWWLQIYSPLEERLGELDLETARVMQGRKSVAKTMEKLSADEKGWNKTEEDLSKLADLMVPGKSIEAVNAGTQATVQEVLDAKEITVQSYREVGAIRWRGHSVGRVELRFSTSIQGLSDVLEFVENLDKVVRVDSLNVSHSRVRGKTTDQSLTVTMQLGTLFVTQLQ